MSDPDVHGAPPSDDLQFENAEFTATPPGLLTCAACAQEIRGTYYEVNGKVICDSCRDAVQARREEGSGLVRFVRASLFGAMAAVGGYAIYFGVSWASGWEAAIISILVGFMVGSAVRAGARHRGGWLYQSLAVFLTYSAIAAAYASLAFAQWAQQEADREQENGKQVENLVANLEKDHAAKRGAFKPKGEDTKPETAKAKGDRTIPGAAKSPEAEAAKAKGDSPRPGVAAKDAAGTGARKEETDEPDPEDEIAKLDLRPKGAGNPLPAGAGFLVWIVVLLTVVGYFYAIPIIIGASAPISLLIVGFALWEAWKLNRRVAIVFNGPYDAGTATPRPATEQEDHA